MTLPLPKEPAKKARFKLWSEWLVNYKQQFENSDNKFSYIPNAAWLLNDLYWRLVEQYLRPILKTPDEGQEIHRIHPYKIISTSEIAVMMVEPITLKGDMQLQRQLNAGLAWFVATQIIEGWDTGNRTVLTAEHITRISTFKELIEIDKSYPESFAAEHIKWLTMLNVTTEKPLLINAQCWRLFYLACFAVATNGKLK